MKFNIYKKEKFLENSNSFALVSFFADPQKNFVSLRNLLFTYNLSIKVIKSRSIQPSISNYVNSDLLSFLKNVSKGPVFLIQNIQKNHNILENILKINENDFLKRQMRVLLCFIKGKVYSGTLLFSINKINVESNLFSVFNKFKYNFIFFLEINKQLLVKLFIIYLNNNKII